MPQMMRVYLFSAVVAFVQGFEHRDAAEFGRSTAHLDTEPAVENFMRTHAFLKVQGPGVFNPLSLSMSLSMDITRPSATPVQRVTVPPSVSDVPSVVPTMTAAPTVSYMPSSTPSVSSRPTESPAPSEVPTVTLLPTVTATPQESQFPTIIDTRVPSAETTDSVAFTCTPNGVDATNQTAGTRIDIKVSYVVETTASPDEYLSNLEERIVASALTGALQCSSGGPLFGDGGAGVPSSIEVTTTFTGKKCTPQVSVCTIGESKFGVALDEKIDKELAEFLAYVLLQEEMNKGLYVLDIPLLDRVEYLSPSPLTPPTIITEQTPPPISTLQGRSTITASPWTIGAFAAVSIGGIMAIWVWGRNRRTRNRRHIQLLEDMSINDSTPSGRVTSV